MKKKRKILIIKTGFSEFLDRGISTTVSLGDVLFCTTLLHLYKNDHVTWVTSSAAKGLFKDNPFIHKLLIFGSQTFRKITCSHYDIFINLEKDIGICAFLKQVKAKKKFGFYFNEKIHDIATCRQATRYLLAGQENHRFINCNTAELLYQAVGKKWNGQGMILTRKGKRKPIYDIGFNYSVGTKWPTKGWPLKKWKSLEKSLRSDFTVSWQKGHKNIRQYINWIDSCNMIVTSDSLGQLIAQALGKKVLTLFGPTNHKRMRGIPNISILPSRLRCCYRPCYLPICKNKKFCMEEISPLEVATKVRNLEGRR
ncbi:MAG: glycosyltransferase family 9 protein [Candidatus Aceula meridiana]|nr:glycosyltransferase family 9 protein [Candidatus Aceula meridiana]